ncbi:MAG: glycosyltransferase family 9 protein [Deltaproteobacteria bacterium]|nr:glycosyltransferase family 9 protein [Deltaproteobacteria bacterium]
MKGRPSKLKIGIIRTSSIGDVVLASSCLSLLRYLKVEAELVWIGRAPAIQLLQAAYPELSCLEITKETKTREILDKLQDLSVLIDLQTNLRSRIITQTFKSRFKRPVLSCPKIHFQRNRLIWEGRLYGRRRPLPRRAMIAMKPQYRLMSDSLLTALQGLKVVKETVSIPKNEAAPHLQTEHALEAQSQHLQKLRANKWLALAPGASYPTKQAPEAVFSEILANLAEQVSSAGGTLPGLAFFGDAKDKVVCEELIRRVSWKAPVLNFAGELSLWENALALKETVCLLSNDSSLGHIAEAVETPTVILFGPTVEGFGFAPRKEESRAFSAPLGCRPCSKHGKSACRFGDKLCFDRIDRLEVAKYLATLITNRSFTNNKTAKTIP